VDIEVTGPAGVLPVSVVIPTYNRPAMTRRAVLSALGQHPQSPAEVIVVDDCSTDETRWVAAEAGARVIRHESNQGEGAARNTGVAAATQPWLALLDSDDEWMPHLLATLWALRDGHVLVAGSAMVRSDEPGWERYAGPGRRRSRRLRSPAALIYPGNILPNSGVLVRTEVVRAVGGYDQKLRFGADLDLWLRVLEAGTGIVSPDVVVDYHHHPGQVTADRRSMARAQLAILQAYGERPWWSRTRVEAWRGGAAWDELRRRLTGEPPRSVVAPVLFILRNPVRFLGVLGILSYRRRMRQRTVQMRPRGERSASI